MASARSAQPRKPFCCAPLPCTTLPRPALDVRTEDLKWCATFEVAHHWGPNRVQLQRTQEAMRPTRGAGTNHDGAAPPLWPGTASKSRRKVLSRKG